LNAAEGRKDAEVALAQQIAEKLEVEKELHLAARARGRAEDDEAGRAQQRSMLGQQLLDALEKRQQAAIAALEAADLNAKNAEEYAQLAAKKIQAENALAGIARTREQAEKVATHAANRRLANERDASASARARMDLDAIADEAMRDRIAAEEAIATIWADEPAVSAGRELAVTKLPRSRAEPSSVRNVLRVIFVVAAFLGGVSVGYMLKMPGEGAVSEPGISPLARQAIRETVVTRPVTLPPPSENDAPLVLRLDFGLRTTPLKAEIGRKE